MERFLDGLSNTTPAALLDAHAANARAPLYRAEIEAPVMIDKDLSLPFEPEDEWVSVPN